MRPNYCGVKDKKLLTQKLKFTFNERGKTTCFSDHRPTMQVKTTPAFYLRTRI